MTSVALPREHRAMAPARRAARLMVLAFALVLLSTAGGAWSAAGNDLAAVPDPDAAASVPVATPGSAPGFLSTAGDASSANPFGLWAKYARNPVLEDTSVNATLVKSILSDLNDPLRRPLQFPHPTLGNRYWMAYANLGFGGSIRLAYSSDLLTWTRYGGNPILALGANEYYMSSPNLCRDGDVYYLVYDLGSPSSHGETQRIAYATARSPLGPWQRGAVILDLGGPGQWDEGRVTEPHLFKDGDTYYLYYMGDLLPPYARGEQVGIATAPAASFPRGPWTKRGVALPIKQSATAWDRGLTADPSVIKIDGTFYMLYTGSTGGSDWKLGIARASHPLGPWQRPDQPVLAAGPAAWDNYSLVRGTLTYHEGKYYLFYSGRGVASSDARFRGGVAIADPKATPVVKRVNCGGPSYVDSAGEIWEADQAYSSGSWGYVYGMGGATAQSIANTTDAPLYQDDRSWSSSSTPGYTFNVPAGTYEITFKFAETQYTAAGRRKFDVRVRGGNVLSGFDIVAAAGGAGRAVDRVVIVDVPDGVLNIGFIHLGVGNPMVNAIKIRQIGAGMVMPPTATPPPAPTRTATRTPTSPPSTATATPTRVLYTKRVNCGALSYTDSLGQVWYADQPYATGSWGYTYGDPAVVSNPVSGTLDEPLYQAARTWTNSSTPAYSFTVPNGRYEVTLKFVEPEFAATGQRVFDIRSEGVVIYQAFDIVAAAGGKNVAVDRTFALDVTDGVLTVGVVDLGRGDPRISAVQIIQLS